MPRQTTSDDAVWVPLEDPPRPKLSILRVLFALLALVAAVGGAIVVIRQQSSTAAAEAQTGTPWFAPYVDVTLTPTYAFQDPAANPVSGVFLGFIVSQPNSPCTPDWGGYYTLAAAANALNLDSRLAQVRGQGGNPMVSFGGQANSELAVGCRQISALTAAYLAPVERYHVNAIDLDVEGAALADAAANGRRALAIAAAQRARSAHGGHLSVWLTLPVAPDGLTADGLAVTKAMLAAHVSLTGVNVMAMDFGYSADVQHGMIGPVERAMRAAHAQLASVYRGAGIGLTSNAAWRHLGVTVMIGQNDVPGERFTLDDALALTAYAAKHHVARVSMWSLNRDSECGSVFAQIGELSNVCSGVSQAPLQFTRIFSRLGATETARSAASTIAAVPQVGPAPVDDPTTSPYPIWMPTAMYVAGYKVVWHRDIYQAKWFSQGQAPDTPVPSASQTPWLLIGPVASGKRAPKPTLFDSASHSTWSATAVYHQGDRVIYAGLPYLAKWYTHANQPSGTLPPDPQSPWQPLFTLPGEPPLTAANTEAR